MNILEAKKLYKTFPVEGGIFRRKIGEVRALNNLSISLEPGQVLGVVGESGSGKTTLGKVLCKLHTPEQGSISIEGKDINLYSRLDLSNKIQMIFQDPFASLNPKLTIGTILGEASNAKDQQSRKQIITDTLETVGLPENIISSYPHQFSGGQRQRIALARALIRQPKIIIADEPLSSLDISIQNQLLNLFVKLKEKHLISFVFISHDLVTTSNLADYLIVMQNGSVVEEGPIKELIQLPSDPYTKNLISAVPQIISEIE